ncbi:MAG: hypothetical protein HGA45_11915 [Chloroflexales bacterium]|nr:hypothetical protein [Chloroflexales bacterium]
MLVEDAGECSGLATLRELVAGASPIPLAGAPFLLSIPLPDAEGAHERAVEVADQIGNTLAVTLSVVYDRTAPAGAFGEPLTVTPDPRATVLQTLAVAGATYSDGDGALPWAVALVVSRQPIDAQAPGLDWAIYPLGAGRIAWDEASGAQGATVSAEVAVNLADLLPRDQLTPGAYHYALALVDPAGNLTASAGLGQIELASVTYPTVYAPAVAR